ncbi:uncharacterized protein LOC115590264 [Sparus aurata]|uniref:uncharacterized protein LOC115590264 n=1 Tax=Sparus aurata TaxID=8175 RepID=UPI0011C12906|nr:uncharacterized protein LOC115590264 [Sparus aurata]
MAEKKKQLTNSSSSIPGDTPGHSISLMAFRVASAVSQKMVSPPRPKLSEEEMLHLKDRLRKLKVIHAPSKKMVSPPSSVSPSVDPPKTQSAPLPSSVSVKSELSMLEPRDSHIQKTQRLIEALWAAPRKMLSPQSSVSPSLYLLKTQSAPLHPSVSVKSDSLDSHLQKTLSELLRETDSRASSDSVKSESSMFELPSFHLQETQSEPFSEADSVISSVSMRSALSMFEPPSFNQKKQSCSVCEEAVKDPVPLLCGHWSCKQCVYSFRDEYGETANYSCKKCGRRPETDQDLQSVLLEKKIKRVEMETEKLQAEKETFQAEKETFQAEKETFQAEKEKLQAEKEAFELEKRKLTLEIQSLEQKGKYTNNDQGDVIPKTRIPYI